MQDTIGHDNNVTSWDAVQEYIKLGFVCLPTENGGKKNPALSEWKKYQTVKPTYEDYELWFKDNDVGVGTLCGKISGLIMIDLDSYKPHAKIINLNTPVKVRTGGGGLHGYFKYREGQGNRATKDAIDIKSDGGFAVLPPTIHKSGNVYKWEIEPGLTLAQAMEQLPEISGELLEWMQNNKLDGSQPENDYIVSSSMGVGEGERNDKLYRFACSVLARNYNPDEALEMVAQVNRTYAPPLADNEVYTLFQSAADFISKTTYLNNPPRNADVINHPFKPISISELMNKEFSDIQWVVEQLIPAEAIVAISGLPSAYKTWLILCLAIEVAKGGVLFDNFTTTKTGVLIIDEETGERWMQQRVSKLQCEMELPIYLLSRTGFKLTEATVKQLLTFAKEKQIGLIVFDSLVRIHAARDENDAVEMAKVFGLFQKLNREGIATAFTHHNRKPGLLRSSNPSQDMRGSSDILAAVDCHLAIERKDEAITITQTKLRQGQEIRPFKLNIINDDNELRFEFAGEVEEEQTKKADWKESIKDFLSEQNSPKYKKEMFDELSSAGVEGGYSTFKSAVKEMLDKGEIFERRGEKNKVFCSLKAFDEQVPIEESASDS